MTTNPKSKTIVIGQSTYDQLKSRKIIARESFNSVIVGMFNEIEMLKKSNIKKKR